MVVGGGMVDQMGTLLESPEQQLRRIGDRYLRINSTAPCPQWHWYHSCFGATAAGAAELLPGVLSGSSAGCPCQTPTTAGGASGRPMEGDGKAARGKALATHVGCCVFGLLTDMCAKMHKQRYAFQNALCLFFWLGNTQYGKKIEGTDTADMHTKTHRQRDAFQNALSKRCIPKCNI